MKDVKEILEDFMNDLFHCDTVCVVLTGCGSSEYNTQDIHMAINELIDQNNYLARENGDLKLKLFTKDCRTTEPESEIKP